MKKLMTIVLVGLVAMAISGCEKTTIEGPGGQSLTLVVPASVTIARGETRAVEVQIERENVTGGVGVSISNLPSGVRARDASKTVETDAATFILEASPTAGLVKNQSVAVTIEGPDGMRGTEEFRLTVTE